MVMGVLEYWWDYGSVGDGVEVEVMGCKGR